MLRFRQNIGLSAAAAPQREPRMSLMDVPLGRLPQRSKRRLIDLLAIGGLAAALAACTSDVSLDDFNLSRKITNVKNAAASTLSFQGGRDFSVRPVTQAD